MAVCNVNVRTGDVYHDGVDLHLRGFIPFKFVRDYDSSRRRASGLGFGWRHNHHYALRLDRQTAVYEAPDVSLAVPHPDFDQDAGDGLKLRTARQGRSVFLSDWNGTVFQFDPLTANDDSILRLVSTVDAHGNRFQYDYAGGQLGAVTHPDGRVVSFAYDRLGYLAAIALVSAGGHAGLGELARYTYDAAGDLRAVHHPGGAVTQYVYDDHRLTAHINPLGGVTRFRYDRRGRCIHTVRDDGTHERTITWDDDTPAVEVRNSRGSLWRYVLTDQRQVKQEIDPLGRCRDNIYDQDGNLQVVTDGVTPPSVSLFLADRRVLVEQRGTLSAMTQFDDKMRVVEARDGAGSGWIYSYNDSSDRVTATDPGGNTWRFGYEADGWLSWASDPRGYELQRTRSAPRVVDYDDMFGRRATLGYTVLGLVERTMDGLGAQTRFDYNALGLVTSIAYADESRVRFAYDAMGNMTSLEREAGSTTLFEYDRFGNAISQVDPAGRRAVMRYDTEGNLVAITDGMGQTCAMAYDLLNRLGEIRLFDGKIQRYEYDARGAVVAVRDGADRNVLRIARNESGRITKKTYPDGTEVAFRWGERGELLEAADAECSVQLEWTPDLRIAGERVNGRSVSYDFDEVGNRIGLSASTGRVIRYEWDARNRLTRMADSGGQEYRFAYDQRDLFTEWRGPSMVQSFEFDQRQFMTRRAARRAADQAMIADRSYGYEPEGRLIQMQDERLGATYQYDILGRLTLVTPNPGGGQTREEYRWDANGNLVLGRDGRDLSYGAGNRLARAGERMFEYDADGNVVAIRENGSRLSLTYDSRGRLSTVTDEQGRTTQYRYDPLGRRISKETGAGRTEFLWDQGALLSEIGPGDATIEYLFLPQTYLPVGVTAGEQHFSYVLDQAGTPTHLIDREGQIAWMGQFSAFGELLAEPINRVPNPLRFQGQYFDAETGLHYNFMRYYDPRTARYVSQDPLGTRSGANLYRYVWNPFNEVDPYGLASLANGVLTIVPICQWSDDQVKESQKKMKAMNNKLKAMGGVTIPSSPVQRCGKTAKDIYEECQKKAKQQNKPPQRNLSETNTKCTNEQADHILEICAGGGEEDCDNLQPLNESVNKSYGSQMGAVVRSNPGAVINKVQISETECTDRASLDC